MDTLVSSLVTILHSLKEKFRIALCTSSRVCAEITEHTVQVVIAGHAGRKNKSGAENGQEMHVKIILKGEIG